MRWSGVTEDGGRGEPRRGEPAAAPVPGGRVPAHPPLAGLPPTLVLLAACAIAWSCARPGQPPGAPEETEPPDIRSVSPARGTVMPELSGRATIQFDEPISAGSGLQQQLVASPAYRYTVTAGHSEISIRPEGGWRPGAVYVLELPAGIADLLNNAREEPVRMVFSTGPDIVPTRIRARLFDRVTGEERTEGRILYLRARGGAEGGVAAAGDSGVSAEDTVPYTSVADTGGVYVLRHVPPGDYWAYGFVDRNRDSRLDRRLEPYDSARVELDSDSGEASVRLFTLEPDSTAPVLGRVETPDSTTLHLGFDDHLATGRAPEDVLVRREGAPGTLPVREVRVLTAADTVPEDTLAADTVPEDTLLPDTLAPDTLVDDTSAAPADTALADTSAAVDPAEAAAPADTVLADTSVAVDPAEAAAPPDTSVRDTLAPDTSSAPPDTLAADMPPRPTRILLVRLGEAMAAGDTYRVRVRGVANVWGVTADADTTFVFTPPADTARADTARLEQAPDTARLEAVPDTAASDTAAPGGGLRNGETGDGVTADAADPGSLP